ncbi:MAG: response regulator, partial [Clostridia bacterium]|nr:response regulator [Clostridia bacterium]
MPWCSLQNRPQSQPLTSICLLLSCFSYLPPFIITWYNVYSVNDGESAVREFQTFQPDLVILDIMLPRMDGWQV